MTPPRLAFLAFASAIVARGPPRPTDLAGAVQVDAPGCEGPLGWRRGRRRALLEARP